MPPGSRVAHSIFGIGNIHDASTRLQRSHAVCASCLISYYGVYLPAELFVFCLAVDGSPLPSLSFSPLDPDRQHYLLVSSCKDGIPMVSDSTPLQIAVIAYATLMDSHVLLIYDHASFEMVRL